MILLTMAVAIAEMMAVTDSDSDRLRKFLHAKIAKRRKQIHPAHNPRFNHDMQLEIDCIEFFIEHHKYYRMLNNYSVLMMLLVVTASLVGISSIYQYVKGQGSPAATPQPQQQAQKAKSVTGNVILVTIYTSSDGKACLAEVRLPSDRPNNLGIRPGGAIELLAPDESICVLFGQSKIGKIIISFDIERLTTLNTLPSTLRGNFPPDYQYLYRAIQVRM